MKTDEVFDVVQDAVDASASGSTLLISGICFGRVAISNKALRLIGKPTTIESSPTLDGERKARVLTITGADVVVRDLTLTHGRAVWGGGAQVSGSYRKRSSTLVLQGATLITESRASSGGGGVNVAEHATLKMFDSSAIIRNESKWYGGGIGTLGTVILNDSVSVSANDGEVGAGIAINEPGILILNDHASVNKNDATRHGGGIVNYYGTVILNDAAEVVSNAAAKEGGGVRNFGDPSNKGMVYVCSDRVALRPNEPNDPPDTLSTCPTQRL